MAAAYSTTVTIAAATYTAITAPGATVPFEPKYITVVNPSTSAADIVYVSFDGVNDHGVLYPDSPASAQVFEQRATKVWLRYKTGAAATVDVSVAAEA